MSVLRQEMYRGYNIYYRADDLSTLVKARKNLDKILDGGFKAESEEQSKRAREHASQQERGEPVPILTDEKIAKVREARQVWKDALERIKGLGFYLILDNEADESDLARGHMSLTDDALEGGDLVLGEEGESYAYYFDEESEDSRVKESRDGIVARYS